MLIGLVLLGVDSEILIGEAWNRQFRKTLPAKGICAPKDVLYSVLLINIFKIVNEEGEWGGGGG